MVADRYAVYSFHLQEVKIVGEIGKYTKFHLQQTEKVSRIVKIEITSLAGASRKIYSNGLPTLRLEETGRCSNRELMSINYKGSNLVVSQGYALPAVA
jgi:hypothetical protein